MSTAVGAGCWWVRGGCRPVTDGPVAASATGLMTCARRSGGTRVAQVDVSSEFAYMMSVKGDNEKALIKRACQATCDLYSKYVKRELINMIDDDKVRSRCVRVVRAAARFARSAQRQFFRCTALPKGSTCRRFAC